jgi:hypothetical protein
VLVAAIVEAVAARQADSLPVAAGLGVALGMLIAHKRDGARATALLELRLGTTLLPKGSADGMRVLASRLSAAASEPDVLRVACDELHALFPGACAQAVAVLQDGKVVRLEVAAMLEPARLALLRSLPCALARDGASNNEDAVSFVCLTACEATRDVIIADSADWPAGVDAFADWAAALEGGCDAAQFVTARLVSGTATAGFCVLAFPAAHTLTDHALLHGFCRTVGDALLSQRYKDAAKTAAVAHSTSMAILTQDRQAAVDDGLALAVDVFPPHLVTRARARRRESIDKSNPMFASSTLEETPEEDLMTDNHECVTCIFADICGAWLACACCCSVAPALNTKETPGFTRIAGLLAPEEAMQLLDRLFQRFDSLATAHGVYKGASALRRR